MRNTLKNLLAKSEIEQVIEILLSLFTKDQNVRAYDSTVMCSSSYYHLKNKILQNIGSQEYLFQEQNRLTKSLLDIINAYVEAEKNQLHKEED